MEKINHPAHYAGGEFECIDIIAHYPFEIGSAIKYLWRAGKKEGESMEDDLKKALWYVRNALQGLCSKERDWRCIEDIPYLDLCTKRMGIDFFLVPEQVTDNKKIKMALDYLLKVGFDNKTAAEPGMMLRLAEMNIENALAELNQK